MAPFYERNYFSKTATAEHYHLTYRRSGATWSGGLLPK